MKQRRNTPAQGTWDSTWQETYQEDAYNGDIPLWLRVEKAALARHYGNLHAPFAPGELADMLSRVDLDTGELIPPERTVLYRAIKKAKDHGLIRQESTLECIILPAHRVVEGTGRKGEPGCCHTFAQRAKELAA